MYVGIRGPARRGVRSSTDRRLGLRSRCSAPAAHRRGVRQERDGRTRARADRAIEATRSQHAERQESDAADVHRIARPGERRVHHLPVGEDSATRPLSNVTQTWSSGGMPIARRARTAAQVTAARADESVDMIVPSFGSARAPVINRRRPSGTRHGRSEEDEEIAGHRPVLHVVEIDLDAVLPAEVGTPLTCQSPVMPGFVSRRRFTAPRTARPRAAAAAAVRRGSCRPTQHVPQLRSSSSEYLRRNARPR